MILVIMFAVAALILIYWSENHKNNGFHMAVFTIAGLLWLVSIVLAFVKLGLVKGLVVAVVTFIVGGAIMPTSRG